MTGHLGTLHAGYRIMENRYMTIDGDPVEVNRTWRERWWARLHISFPVAGRRFVITVNRPVKPWKRTKWITPQIPNPDAFISDGMLIMHPETARAFRERLELER